MKKAFLMFFVLFFVNSISFAQESGNRIYGNQGYYNQNKRQPATNTGNLSAGNFNFYAIESSVLINLKADAFVAVFGINEEAKQSAESNDKVNARIESFTKALNSLGVARNDIFIDFITQNRVYDYTVEGRRATENFTGFETKKTIAVRYKSRDLFEKLVTTAAGFQIFDLIKVDYIVSDFDAVRERLFELAVKIIKTKRDKYLNLLNVPQMTPVGLAMEKYDAFYPGESYQRYQAFETGSAYTGYDDGSKVVQRKSFTFYYEPLDGGKFDAVINPIGIEPVVQYTIYLRMDYDTGRVKEK